MCVEAPAAGFGWLQFSEFSSPSVSQQQDCAEANIKCAHKPLTRFHGSPSCLRWNLPREHESKANGTTSGTGETRWSAEGNGPHLGVPANPAEPGRHLDNEDLIPPSTLCRKQRIHNSHLTPDSLNKPDIYLKPLASALQRMQMSRSTL